MYKTNYSVFFNFSVSNCSGLMIPDTIISGKVPQERCSMSKRKRRSFTTEFKHEAACLVVDQGYTYPEACRSLDLTPTHLPNSGQ